MAGWSSAGTFAHPFHLVVGGEHCDGLVPKCSAFLVDGYFPQRGSRRILDDRYCGGVVDDPGLQHL
jgi:hypothetical protein